MLSVAKMKENLRISYDREDDFIKDCVLEAYDWLAGGNGWLNRTVINSTWVWTGPAFSNLIELPRPPLVSVTSFRYMVDGVYADVDPATWVLEKRGAFGFGRITRAFRASWPTDIDTHPEAVEIEFVAGMGSGTEVRERYPALVKGLKLLASDYFRHREDTMVDIRIVEIDRRIVNGVNRVAGRYRYMNNHA